MQFTTLAVIATSVFAATTPLNIGEGIACAAQSYCLQPKSKAGCPIESAVQGDCASGLVCCLLDA